MLLWNTHIIRPNWFCSFIREFPRPTTHKFPFLSPQIASCCYLILLVLPSLRVVAIFEFANCLKNVSIRFFVRVCQLNTCQVSGCLYLLIPWVQRNCYLYLACSSLPSTHHKSCRIFTTCQTVAISNVTVSSSPEIGYDETPSLIRFKFNGRMFTTRV